jgi:hypothetical protein
MRSRPPPFLGDILSLGTYGGGEGVRGGEGDGGDMDRDRD